MSRQVPELQRQTAIQAEVGQAPFEVTLSNLASSPTALGKFGAKVAISAAQAIQERRGYEAGLEPTGDALPPITDADKVYVNSYVAQAQNTLGVQATTLMQQGQTELSKLNELSPQALADYQQNMTEGMNKILEQAPLPVRANLEKQFQTAMVNNMGSLQRKMQGQQKAQALQTATMKNQADMQTAYDAGREGNEDLAQETYNATIERIGQMQDAKMITPTQAEAKRKAARISWLTGVNTGKAFQAFKDKKIDQFLADFMDNKPEGMSSLEWDAVAKNVLNEVSLAENLQRRNEASLYSEGTRLLQEGGLTSDFLSQLESETTDKAKFNQFMGQVYAHQFKADKSISQARLIASQWGNQDIPANASPKAIDEGFSLRVQDEMVHASNKGQPIDQEQAEMQVMMSSKIPVPSFTKKMNQDLTSFNPQSMLNAYTKYQTLSASNPAVVQNLSSRAKASRALFDTFLNGGDPADVAAEKTKESILNTQKSDFIEAVDRENSRINTLTNSPSKLMNWGSRFTPQKSNINPNDLLMFASQAKALYKANFSVTGNEDAAQAMTEEAINRAYGISSVNGQQEFTFLPIESQLGLADNAAPLIREDIYNQLEQQFAYQKEAFEAGQKSGNNFATSYFRVKERPSFDAYLKSREYIQGLSYKDRFKLYSGFTETDLDKKAQEAQAIVSAYEGQLEIEQVFAGGETQTYQAIVKALPGAATDPTGQIGSYSVMIRDSNGGTRPLYGMFTGRLQESVYKPNVKFIQDRAAGMPESQASIAEGIAQLRRMKAMEETKNASLLESFGRSIF